MDALKVLLVDDEVELIATMVERMSFRGIEAETCAVGSEVLNVMREKKFDVIVVDVKMPGISGLEVMAGIKKEHPDIPVILITGHGSVKDGEEGMAKGAFAYLAKPIQLEDLIAKMKEAVAGRG